MALDPFAVAEGAQQGQNIWNQQQNAQNTQLQHALAMPGQLDAYSDQADQRTASAYMAPLLNEMQNNDGSDLTYLIKKRDQVLSDPAYHAMTSRAQSYVMQHLGSAATQTAQQYQNSGQLDAAHQLYSAFKQGGAMSPNTLAGAGGDPSHLVNDFLTRNPTSGIKANPDGTYTVPGLNTPITGVDLGNAIMRNPSNPGAEIMAMGSAAEAAHRQQTQQQAQLRFEEERQLGIQGFIRQPDGSFLNPHTGATSPALPENIFGSTFSTGAVPGVKPFNVFDPSTWGGASTPGVAPSASGMSTLATTVAGLTVPGGTSAPTNPAVSPFTPDAQQPVGNMSLAQLQQEQAQLQQQLTGANSEVLKTGVPLHALYNGQGVGGEAPVLQDTTPDDLPMMGRTMPHPVNNDPLFQQLFQPHKEAVGKAKKLQSRMDQINSEMPNALKRLQPNFNPDEVVAKGDFGSLDKFANLALDPTSLNHVLQAPFVAYANYAALTKALDVMRKNPTANASRITHYEAAANALLKGLQGAQQ